MMFFGGFVSVAIVVGYPTLGLKMPQKDNPLMWRKKYGTASTVQQFQQLAMVEYGGKIQRMPETNVMYTNKGFQMVGNGVRIDLPSYGDLVC